MLGADHYEFQLASDSGFSAPAAGYSGHFFTNNTHATISATPPDGDYYWRVRGFTKSGALVGERRGRQNRRWTSQTTLYKPGTGASPYSSSGLDAKVVYPTTRFVLSWKPVLGAAQYRLEIATEQQFASLVGGRPVQTSGTSYTPTTPLTDGVTYWWHVAPIDADGHVGQWSAKRTFTWQWLPKDALDRWQATFRVVDLVEDREFYDPQLFWGRIDGAARYELEINFSHDFAPGSRVCCSKPFVSSAYSPPKLLDNNTYYWRVRAIDAGGKQSDWRTGQPFLKSFDTRELDSSLDPSIRHFHMRTNLDDTGSSGVGFTTDAPIAVWDPVPGASAYEVNVVPYLQSICDWGAAPATSWNVVTGITAWTPYGRGGGTPPYIARNAPPVKQDTASLLPGRSYCIRVRALADVASRGRVYGDYTYMNGDNQPAFTAAKQSGGDAFGPGTYLAAHSNVAGAEPGSQGATPLFTWKAVSGAAGYWIYVARDRSFTTPVDVGYTTIPAFAPRITYADETTQYWWVVMPARSGIADPSRASPQSFEKLSQWPAPYRLCESTMKASTGADCKRGSGNKPDTIGATQPTYRWSPVLGARSYHLQVSSDPKFLAGVLDDVTTNSTAFTSDTTLPPGKKLYWRVQALDENKIGLNWSYDLDNPRTQPQVFEHLLAAPRPLVTGSGDQVPVLQWSQLKGAIGYDVHLEFVDGTGRDFVNIPSAAFAPTSLRGLGVARWSVRAEFPTASRMTPGPYSKPAKFKRTLLPPRGERANMQGGGVLFTWSPNVGARSYRVEVSSTADFGHRLDTREVETTAFAPTLTNSGYLKGGRLYWHVASVDADRNVGNFSKTFTVSLPRRAAPQPHGGRGLGVRKAH